MTFPLPGDPSFVEELLRRRPFLTHGELLTRLRVHRLVAVQVQGTLDSVLQDELEELIGDGVLVELEPEGSSWPSS